MDPNSNKLPASNMRIVGSSDDLARSTGDVSKVNQENPMSNELMPSDSSVKRVGDSTPLSQLSTPPVQPPSAAGQDEDDDMEIEKECIRKAKEIIEQTSGDPFRQTKELNKVKAELLKRRFGKELKMSEE